jgi:hypothetical protein
MVNKSVAIDEKYRHHLARVVDPRDNAVWGD